MRWYRNTWSIYYGNSGGEGSTTARNIVIGPYLYNNKLYGTAEQPMYSLYLQSALLDQNYNISPVNGSSFSYSYFRVIGAQNNSSVSSGWSSIDGATISGQYKFNQSIAGTTFNGWSIPCNFVLTKGDGTVFLGDSLQSPGSSPGSPSSAYCGIVYKNVKEGTSLTFGSTSSSGKTLPSDQQYSVVDFGTVPQEIPKFVKDWIEANADAVVEPAAALTMAMKSNKGLRLLTENTYCERDIEIIPTLQEKTITKNGTATPDSGYCGIGKVNINVQPSLQEKTVTTNGVVAPDTGYDGLSKVTISIDISDSPLPIEVATADEMNALLSTAAAGAIYKYTGETTDTYENGALYVVEAIPITFTIANKTYQADEGMLWEDWLLSDYNTDGFTANGNSVVASNGYKVWWSGHSGSAAETFISDTIRSSYSYTISQYNPAN